MELLITSLKLAFSAFMLGVIALYILTLLLSWTWAQNSPKRKLSLGGILSHAAVEWGSILTLVACHFWRLSAYHEAPPLDRGEPNTQQLPVILVPSLHSGSSILALPYWRLKKHFWMSLWPFQWKSFLKDPNLLKDQLTAHIENVLERTKAPSFRLVSFGSSHPIVGAALAEFKNCDKWISISGASELSETMKFVASKRCQNAYKEFSKVREADLLIFGDKDSICYPKSLWQEKNQLSIPEMGHYGAILHSSCIRKLLKELS